MKTLFSTLAIVATACASAPQPKPAQTKPSYPVPQLSTERLAQVHRESPELADVARRLLASSRAAARRGDEAAASEFGRLAQVTLLAASELIAKSDAAEAEAERNAEKPKDPESQDDTEQDPSGTSTNAPRAESGGASSSNATARARRAARRPKDERPDGSTEEPAAAAEVRERLALLASGLSALGSSITAKHRVEVDSIENMLIQGDRMLAEGLIERAAELASEAERKLSALTGKNHKSDAAGSPPRSRETFRSDIRRRIGKRAIVRGNIVAVRLDPLMHYRDNTWQTRTSSVLRHMRTLVRGYRSMGLQLVTTGSPSRAEFREKRDELSLHLASRFQIASARLRWASRAPARLPDGTYLVFVHRPGE